MLRRYPVSIFIVLFTAVMLVIGYQIYWQTETSRVKEVAKIHKAPSQIYARMLVRYDKPPVYEEEYRMQDIEGVSTFEYRIRGYNGRQITITAPPKAMYDVSFFFGALEQDGVWQIVNQAPAGDTDVHYTVFVKQLVDFKQGDRTVTFTDPHYWATLAGRQYSIDLSKNKPTDLLTLQGTQRADKRYETIVDDFRTFGPSSFRARIASARASLGLTTPLPK